MLLLLSLLAAHPVVTVQLADERIAAARDEARIKAGARYRLDPGVADVPDGKGKAVAITGADCQRIGTVYCTSKPRTIYSAAY